MHFGNNDCMYKIIGADQKEYGPITAEQMVEWISQGRANMTTLAKSEADAAWRPLSQFPEFAAALAAKNPPLTAPGAAFYSPERGLENARTAVAGPAIGLIVTAILGFINAGLSIVVMATGTAFNMSGFGGNPETERISQLLGGGFGIVTNAIGIILGVVILIGAVKMRKLESFALCVTASVLAMIPILSPCCCLGLPFGIWALVVLNKPEVKSQFH